MTVSAKELSYVPLGPFKLRLPFIHYKIEKVEFIQGLILGATALSSIFYITDYLGLPYEVAYSMVILEVFLYVLHTTLGDPVIPGWITPALPLTLAYLAGFEEGTVRIQAMIALQLIVAAVFLFMGITGLASRFVKKVPNSLKAGILLATPITVMQGQLAEGGGFAKFPISLLVGFTSLILISYSKVYEKLRVKYPFFDTIGKYGNLFPYLISMIVGILVGELSRPVLEIGTFFKLPDVAAVIDEVSIFGVGMPSIELFIQAIPLALVCYIISFGDFVTSKSLVEDAQTERNDEIIDFNENRSNLIIGIRNMILGLLAPFPPLSGPLWAGMMVSTSQRYKEGKEAMTSLIGGMASFRIGTFLCVITIPMTSFMQPVFGVGGSITLLFQAVVSGKIGMDYCRSDLDKMIAVFTAVVIAFAGSTWGLLVGILLNILLGNSDKSKETASHTEKEKTVILTD